MDDQIDFKAAAMTSLRRLARIRAAVLLTNQDQTNQTCFLLPTCNEEVDLLAELMRDVVERERKAIVWRVIQEIDAADTAKNKKLSVILNRICDDLKARSGTTELAVAR